MHAIIARVRLLCREKSSLRVIARIACFAEKRRCWIHLSPCRTAVTRRGATLTACRAAVQLHDERPAPAYSAVLSLASGAAG